MCGRYTLHSSGEGIAEHFGLDEFSQTGFPPRFNVAPSQEVPAVRQNAGGSRELAFLRWGLVPHWSPTSSPRYATINARAETAAVKPAFRDSFRGRRCLLPADGFYEWEGPPTKQPWHVRRKDSTVFAFAGLWDRWRGRDGEVLESCTILVTEPNELVRPLHDRMPVILAPEEYDAWLDVRACDREALEALLRPYPSERLEAYRVTTRVNQPANDDETCLAPLGGE